MKNDKSKLKISYFGPLGLKLFTFLFVILLFDFYIFHSVAKASLSINLSSSPNSGSLSQGLVGYWTFDGKNLKTNVTDSSGSGNTGRLVGLGATSTLTVAGAIGQGLRFPGAGTGYVSVPTLTSISAPYTISVWIKPSIATPTGSIISATSSSSNYPYLYFANSSGQRLAYQASPGKFQYGGKVFTASDIGKWIHIVVVVPSNDESNWKMYSNGAVGKGAEGNTGDYNEPGPVAVIGNKAALTGSLTGSLDDLRIYSRALSASEVKQLYAMGSTKMNVSSQNASNSIGSGLVGWWTMDGKNMVNNVADSSGQGNNGMLSFGTLGNTSTSSMVVQGVIGQGLKFDGRDDYVSVPGAVFNGRTAWTISGWFNAQSLASSVTSPFFGDVASGSHPVCRFVNSGSSKIQCYAHNGTSFFVNNLQTTTTFVTNKWYLLTFTYDGNIGSVYVNGIFENSGGSPGTLTTSTGDRIGGGQNASSAAFKGKIDDVRVYSRALSSTEIQQLYNLGASKFNVSPIQNGDSLSTGLVGYWTFDGKNLKNNVGDSSGLGNTGFLQASTTATSSLVIAGKIGQGLNFNTGGGTVNTGNFIKTSTRLTPTNSTVAFWFKLTQNANGNFICEQATSYLDASYSTVAGGRLYMGHGEPSTGSISQFAFPYDTKWHHLVFSWDGTTQKAYLDGAAKTFGNSTGSNCGNAAQNLYIGAQDNGNTPASPTSLLNGMMDDVRVYSRALSPSEVTQLYNMGR